MVRSLFATFGVIVGMVSGRYGTTDCITVEFEDGYQYEIQTQIEDILTGDIFICDRDTKGTCDPIDDEVTLVDYVGWESWREDMQMYEWYLCDGNVTGYSFW